MRGVRGENHPNAKLKNRDVDLIRRLLAERETLIDQLDAAGAPLIVIRRMLTLNGLSYRCIGLKFEISKDHVANIAADRWR